MSSSQKVVNFLALHNKPFTVNDIVKGLEGQLGKTKAQSTLEELVDKGKVIEKTYGKQKIYCIAQESQGSSSASTLRDAILEIDRESSSVESQLKQVDDILQKNNAKLRNLQGAMSLSEAEEKLKQLGDDIENLEFQVQVYEEQSKNIKDKEKIVKNYTAVSKEYSKRKRLCMDVVNAILENYPKSKKQLLEEVGIETDEDVAFNIDTCGM